MFKLEGLGTQSKREFVFELTVKQDSAQLRCIHASGRPTATAIFQRANFIALIARAQRLSAASEPIVLPGRRSRGGKAISLRVRMPDKQCVQMTLVDASGVVVNSTLFSDTSWNDWCRKIRLAESRSSDQLPKEISA